MAFFKVLFLGKGITNSGHCSFLKQKLSKANNEKALQNVIANFFARLLLRICKFICSKYFFKLMNLIMKVAKQNKDASKMIEVGMKVGSL